MSALRKSHVQVYLAARQWLVDTGFESELQWQAALDPKDMQEDDFLRQAAWVVYCSGFRESCIRRYFNHISLCFYDWDSAREISENSEKCVATALRVFGHRGKHESVALIAKTVCSIGFEVFKARICDSPLPTLRCLPYLGPITSLHLAKNLGFNLAKPDRHLVMLGRSFGYKNVDQMCHALSERTGDPIGVVDLVLWRYMERIGAGAAFSRLPRQHLSRKQ